MSLLRTSLRLPKPLQTVQRARRFHAHPIAAANALPPRLKLDEDDIREAFVHGTGPGGQKINKTACAVQLKHLPTGIVTLCQETRSRSQNRKIGRKVLAEKVEALEKGPESRTAIKAQVKSRKKASRSKKARRKYKAAEEGQEGEEEEEDDDDDDDDEEDEDVNEHEQAEPNKLDESDEVKEQREG